jgi:hypothetical protein
MIPSFFRMFPQELIIDEGQAFSGSSKGPGGLQFLKSATEWKKV